jgi:hypothetical protein
MAGLLDEIRRSEALAQVQQRLQGLLNIPTAAQQFMVSPASFMGLLGRNPLPRETGFAAGATGLPAQEMSVLDPNQAPYMQGYGEGEPIGYGAMALPLAVPATVAGAKALGPTAGRMAESYMQKMGGLSYATPEEYRGSHQAPNAKVYGATLDSLEGIMPADVYSSRGTRLYGLGDPKIDSEWFSAAFRAKGNPDKLVEVYRAVPKGVKEINQGDWVTTSKTYAKMHGENALDEGYEIVSKKVKASTLSSEGYPYEFGYNE